MNNKKIYNEQCWEKFKGLWLGSLYKKQLEITDDTEKFIWEQFNIFFSAAQVIENIPCYNIDGTRVKKENLDSSLIFRQISGGTLRLILESFFRIMYLICAPSEEKAKRLNEIISSFGFVYNKFIKEANKNINIYGALIKNLPSEITNLSTQQPNIRDLLKKTKDINGNNMEHLYVMYSIACLYAHGTVNNSVWDKLFNSNPRPHAPSLNAFNLIYILSFHYNNIAWKLWKEKYREEFSQYIK